MAAPHSADGEPEPVRTRAARRILLRLLVFVAAPVFLACAVDVALRLAGLGKPTGFFSPESKPGFYRTNPDFPALQALRRIAGVAQQVVAQRPEAAEDALLHAHFAHLLEDVPGGRRVAPDDDSVRAGLVDDAQGAAEIRIAGQVFLLDHHRVPQPARGVFELEHAKAAVAVVDAQQGDLLQPDIAVDAARQRVALHTIVLDGGEIPGNDGFRNGGVGGSAVDN